MMLIGAGSVVQAAEKITDYTQIVSGKKYYIGATTGGTDYYFFAAGTYNATQIAGSAKTDKAEAVVLTFEGSGTQWTVKFDSGKYLTLPSTKQNGKVNVVSDPATWTLSNQSGNKIRMAASSEFSLQKNNSGTQFGSYGNTQTDVWLEEYEENVTPTCATPTFSLAEGAVYSGTKVAISTTTTGATIYYTTDGTTPTTSSSVYSDSIEITEATTIKAFAVKTDYNDSEVATAAYTIKQLVQVTGYTIDFENDIDAYVDWTFENVGNTNTAITAYGGSKYGANINDNGNAVTTASIKTKETVALPDVLTCYVSKTTTNTTSSTWYVQVSNNGETWTDVTTSSATDMGKGEWKTITANLSSYDNVFVRIYYNGTNAIRTIDDITITMRDPNAKVTPNVVIDAAALTNDLAGQTNVSAGTVTAAVMDGQTAVENVSVTWSSSNTDVATIDATTGAVTLIATGTTTLTASFAGNDEYNEASGTYELTVIDSNAAGGANNPYTVAQALENTPDTGNSSVVYVKGIVSGFYNDGENILADYSHRYYISDDGTSSNTLMVYNGKGLGNVAFSNADDVLIGDEVVICGMLTNYNGTKEFAKDNYIVSQERVEYYLTGTFNSWSDNLSEMEKLEKNNEGKYSTTMTISENTEFKIRRKNLDGSLTWIGAQAEGSYYLVLSDGDIQMNENGGQNVKFETAGEYTFTFDDSTYKLNVTGFPVPEVKYYLAGDWTQEWGDGKIELTENADGTFSTSKLVGNGTRFKFVKTVDGAETWYGATQSGDDYGINSGWCTNIGLSDAGNSSAFVIQIAADATLSFTLNPDNNNSMTFTVSGWPITADGNMFVKVTSGEDFTDGAYLIVYEDGNLAFDGSLTTSTALSGSGNHIAVDIVNNAIVADATTKASLFYIQGSTIKSASGYYIGQTNNDNGLLASEGIAYTNTISIDNNGDAVINSSGNAYLRYNTQSSGMFRYYKSGTYTAQKAIQLYKLVTLPAVTFSENAEDDSVIAANELLVVNATLERTLSNTYWSTFSVPFDVDAAQVAEVLGENVGLRKFQGSEGTVIKFQEATTIEAGHAYLVKPAETVTNPVFNGVTVVNTTGETDDDSNGYGFVGAVIKKTLETDQTELFLGTDAKFYYPESDAVATMKGLRGYFVVPEGTETSKLSVDVEGSGIATSINSMNIEGMGDGNIYNLNGQRVNAPQKGLYIVNGKKVIIK